MHGATSIGVHDTEPIRDRLPSGAAPAPKPRRTWPPVRVGVLAAVLLMAVLGGLAVIATPPFASADESAHADYGLTIFLEHRLPTLYDHVDPVIPLQEAKPQHTANHPPLFYLLTGPLLALGVKSGHLIAGYLLARSVSVLASMVTVALVAAFAHAVFRGRRPAVTIGAAALAATYAPFVTVSGVLHNDALAVTFSTAVLLFTVLVLRRGPTWPLVAGLALSALAGTAVRASNGSVVLTACLAVLVACVIHAVPGHRWPAGAVQGILRALVVGLTSVVGIGWFFVRNERLYGNALGYGVLEDAFGKTAPPQSWWMLRHPELLLSQVGLPRPADVLTPVGLLMTVPVVAAVAGALLLLRRRSLPARDETAGSRAAGSPAESTVRLALIGLFLVHTAITVVMVMRHVDGGGGIHVRYLFPLLPIVATVAAAGLLRLPGGARRRRGRRPDRAARRGVHLAVGVAHGEGAGAGRHPRRARPLGSARHGGADGGARRRCRAGGRGGRRRLALHPHLSSARPSPGQEPVPQPAEDQAGTAFTAGRADPRSQRRTRPARAPHSEQLAVGRVQHQVRGTVRRRAEVRERDDRLRPGQLAPDRARGARGRRPALGVVEQGGQSIVRRDGDPGAGGRDAGGQLVPRGRDHRESAPEVVHQAGPVGELGLQMPPVRAHGHRGRRHPPVAVGIGHPAVVEVDHRAEQPQLGGQRASLPGGRGTHSALRRVTGTEEQQLQVGTVRGEPPDRADHRAGVEPVVEAAAPQEQPVAVGQARDRRSHRRPVPRPGRRLRGAERDDGDQPGEVR
jgi:hypothetical protein